MARIQKTDNPFPGLRPFREDEEHVFFGRESQTDRMIDKLAPSRFLAIVGPSGSGKSSLVNCGLRPALHRGFMSKAGSRWRIAQLRPGNRPIRSLARALAAPQVLYPRYESSGVELDQIIEATLRISALGLVDMYQQAYPNGDMNLLVLVDQFEELFRYRRLAGGTAADQYGPGEEAVEFVKLLLEAPAQKELPIYIAITMRSDFLGDCAQFEGLPEAINEGQYLVPRMSRTERRVAIEAPAAVGGGGIDPVLLTRLVNDGGDNPDQLSVLQHALNRTWARCTHDSDAEGELRLSHYEDIGSVTQALDRHAEKAYGELTSDRQRVICEKIFRALTDRGTDTRGIRRPTKLGTLCALAGASESEIADVLKVFRKPSRSFLMPPEGEKLEADTVIDISHESLMRVWDRLRNWCEAEARAARTFRRLAETATLYEAGSAGLLHGRELETQIAWWDAERPPKEWADQYSEGWEAARSLLEESRNAHLHELAEAELKKRWERTWRRWIRVYFGIVTLAVLFILAGVPVRNAQSAIALPWLQDAIGEGKANDTWRGIWIVTIFSLPLAPIFLCLLAVSHYGERLYRKVRFQKILFEVAQPKPTASSETAPAKIDPAKRLNTSYARFGRRLTAYVLDSLLSCVMTFCLLMAAAAVSRGPLGDTLGYLAMFLGLLTSWAYQAGMSASRSRATLGMKAAGTIVVATDGSTLTFRRAALRQLARLLSYFGWIGFLIQPFTPRHQALHDLLTASVVLRRPDGKQQ